jgi:hypothetical protein
MAVHFKLTWHWREREVPSEFSPEIFEQWSATFGCMRRFIALYEGTFKVQVGEIVVSLDLDPDLSTIFEYLPGALKDLASGAYAEICFFEQGTDLALELRRAGYETAIHFRVGDYAASQFRSLPQTEFRVSTVEFLSKWIAFARAVLAMLITIEPSLAEDESYRNYQEALSRVELSTL